MKQYDHHCVIFSIPQKSRRMVPSSGPLERIKGGSVRGGHLGRIKGRSIRVGKSLRRACVKEN
jgi:hypothetical protein